MDYCQLGVGGSTDESFAALAAIGRPSKSSANTRSHLKIRILVQGQGGAEFQPADILTYVEDLKQGPNAEIGPKDFFEIASNPGVAQTGPRFSGIWAGSARSLRSSRVGR